MLSSQVLRILRLFMHLLGTILGHDISDNRFTPLCFHAHYLRFAWLHFSVKHVGTYVSYNVFPIFLLHIWTGTFL